MIAGNSHPGQDSILGCHHFPGKSVEELERVFRDSVDN